MEFVLRIEIGDRAAGLLERLAAALEGRPGGQGVRPETAAPEGQGQPPAELSEGGGEEE